MSDRREINLEPLRQDPRTLILSDYVPSPLHTVRRNVTLDLQRVHPNPEQNPLRRRPTHGLFRPVRQEAATGHGAFLPPRLARLFSCCVVVLAFPFFLLANAALTPVPMLMAACSNRFSRWIGGTTFAHVLWGEVADLMAAGGIHPAVRFMLASVPLVGAGVLAGFAARQIALHGVGQARSTSIERTSIDVDVHLAAPLSENIGQWAAWIRLYQSVFADVPDWKKQVDRLTKDAQEMYWTRPLSGFLQTLYEGGSGGKTLREIVNHRDLSPLAKQLAKRVNDVLSEVLAHPEGLKDFLSCLGLSGLGSCTDRPATVFMDLELLAATQRTQRQVLQGKAPLQALLDVGLKRFVHDKTLYSLMSAMQSHKLLSKDFHQFLVEMCERVGLKIDAATRERLIQACHSLWHKGRGQSTEVEALFRQLCETQHVPYTQTMQKRFADMFKPQYLGTADEIEAVLFGWEMLAQLGELDLTPLPYRDFPADVDRAVMKIIVANVTESVRQWRDSTSAMQEFLAQWEPWQQAIECLGGQQRNPEVERARQALEQQLDRLYQSVDFRFDDPRSMSEEQRIRNELAELKRNTLHGKIETAISQGRWRVVSRRS